MADILGTDSHEVLHGTDADDFIYGFAGYDTLDGAEGSDTYVVTADDYQGRFIDIYKDSGTSGTDIILAAEAGITIGIGDGFSYETSGIEVIDGLGGSTIAGDGANQVWDFTGVEILGVDVISGLGGNDNIRGSNAADTIDGGEGHDLLFGGDGADTILGGEGHDELYGEVGRDTLEGGSGNDRIYGGDGVDILNGNAGFDYLDGGEGRDIYNVGLDNAGFVDEYNDTGETGRDVIRAVDDGTVIGLLTGFGPDNGIEVITSFRNENVTIGGTNDAEVWDFSQTILSGIQSINALDGNDTVIGSARRDNIDGGNGHDVIDGGDGNDSIKGGSGNDIVFGNNGRDRIDGGAGHDLLDGGEGRDIYYYNVESNGGFDTVTDTGTDDGRDILLAQEAGVQIGLSSNFSEENGIEVISAGRNLNVTIDGDEVGNNWDFSSVLLVRISSINSGDGVDIVRGNARSNTINGEAGHDQLFGGGGRDFLYGGDDADFLFGESGRDDLFGDAGSDILVGGLGNDRLTGGTGFDTFVFGPDSGRDVITDFDVNSDLIDLQAFGEDFTYEDIRFVQRSNGLRLFVGEESILLLNVFAETIPADIFIMTEVEEVPVEEPVEEPVDEPVIIDDPVQSEGTNGDDVVQGGSGSDNLSGGNGNDTIIGNDGDDNLDGGNANDTLDGGTGNDTLIGSHGDDNLFGDEGDDVLDGGNDNDQLDGGAGNDTLIGFNGRDILIGGDGDDILDGGNDDDILDGGNGNDMLEGFNGRDTLDGGAGDDILSGFNDADILTGGSGNDMLIGGFGNDTFVFGDNAGNDVIADFENHRDTISFEGIVDEFADLTITQDGANAVITSASGTITLTDFDSSQLDANDFFFG